MNNLSLLLSLILLTNCPEVYLKNPGDNLVIDTKVVETKRTFYRYRVEQEDGEWLWLVSKDLKGWAKKGQVIGVGEALQYYHELLKEDPKSAEVYNLIGLVLMDQQDLDLALMYFNKAIELDPDNEWAHNNRGNIFFIQQKLRDALKSFNRVLQINSNNPLAYNNRGNVWWALGLYDKAIEDYKKAISLNKQFLLAYTNLAYIYASCPIIKYRDADKAIELARYSCGMSDYKSPYHLEALAAAHSEKGDFVTAIQLQSRVVQIEPENPRPKQVLELYKKNKPYRDGP